MMEANPWPSSVGYFMHDSPSHTGLDHDDDSGGLHHLMHEGTEHRMG